MSAYGIELTERSLPATAMSLAGRTLSGLFFAILIAILRASLPATFKDVFLLGAISLSRSAIPAAMAGLKHSVL